MMWGWAYAAGFVVGWVLFCRRLIDAWWEAQGRSKAFEVQGGIWVAAGATLGALVWPISLAGLLLGSIIAKIANGGQQDA